MASAERGYYGRLTGEQQAEFGKAVIAKLRSLIGGYGELGVLAEYIGVMLQSSRPAEQIRVELDAFLQDQSKPFTDWLFRKLGEHAGDEPRARKKGHRSREEGEALLHRVMRDAKVGAGPGDAEGSTPGRVRGTRRPAAVGAPEAGEESPAAQASRRDGRRSRSRHRQRRREKPVAPAAANGASPVPRSKVKLIPNAKAAAPAGQEQPGVSNERWQYRASDASAPIPPAAAAAPGAGLAAAAVPLAHAAPVAQAPPVSQLSSAPAVAVASVASAQKRFNPKKWKVIRANAVVRLTEALDSAEVMTLKQGEIIEQVAPPFQLKNGIIRIQIRHPSSPQWPNPVGWATQDATAAGGPKFLEPGPEPIMKPSWRPEGHDGEGKGHGKGTPKGCAGPVPWYGKGGPQDAGPRGPPPRPFQNLTWTPASKPQTA